ncbi:50S ribosomal protein L11 methyltransferase [Myxococcota bacterium]|nr:50S ribosomal protein L11 methyltransferase [Myxococcota bacterium]MBU1431107.1 50S ribosomal protein L11 methyltransferase [Myxococcota bacterium]MBU1897103.1 50S ribosomal protein L11 methyltransferase [Myxococcota bacterium]
MSWFKISLTVPEDKAEWLAYLLAEALESTVEIRDEATLSKGEDGVELHLGFEAIPEGAEAQIREALAVVGCPEAPIHTRREEDESWRDGWKAFFQIERLSARFWVQPSHRARPEEATYAVQILPGLAFGTGNHPTTRNALAILDDWLADKPPMGLIDVGAGTAILAIAAAYLGHHAYAIEIDPDAVNNARQNIEMNGQEARVTLICASIDAVKLDPQPMVIANMIAPLLIQHAEAIKTLCAGELILSGLLEGQREAVLAAYPGWRVVERREGGEGWLALRLARG